MSLVLCATCLICACDMLHLNVRHNSFMYICEVTQWCAGHASFMCVTCLIHMCDMTHLNIQHDLCMYVCEVTYFAGHDSFICATCLIYMCDMTHLCVRHDSFMYVTWLIHVCALTHLCVRACLIRMGDMTPVCDMIYSCVWHCATWLVLICEIPHSHVGHDLDRLIQLLYRQMRSRWWNTTERDLTHEHVRRDSFLRGVCLIHMRDSTHPCDITRTRRFCWTLSTPTNEPS